MSTPKVTVLMSVLNGEEFLAEAIDSILTQTYTDFEFIIVDNASTDRTPEIIRSYDDARVIHLRNSETLNLSQSLNKGLAAARGDYIARLDADDVAMPGRLEKQVRALDSDPAVALVASACTEFGTTNPFPGRPGLVPPTEHSALMIALARESLLSHSSIMFRRDAVQDIGGYPEDYAYCMDYLLYFRLARRYRLACLPEPLVAIRMHEGQITADPSWGLRREQEAATAFREILDYPELTETQRHTLMRYLTATALRLALLHIRCRSFLKALAWTGQALAGGPGVLACVIWVAIQRRLAKAA